MRAENTAITFWLIPKEPERELFREYIRILAERFEAPKFEPHMTVGSGSFDTVRAEWILSQVTKGQPQVRLKIRGIEYSDEYTKTLTVQFEETGELQRLVGALCEFGEAAGWHFDPHLSLIYQKMSMVEQQEMARSVKFPFQDVLFDSIATVACASPTETREDVESWKVLATRVLGD